MPAQRRFGMDHPHYPWSPLPKRPPLRWPEGAQVALCVVVNLEHMEWMPSEGSYWRADLSGGFGNRAFPDYTRKSHREYGHRVGIFRVSGRAGSCGDSANHSHGPADGAELSVSGGALPGAGRRNHRSRGVCDEDDYGEDGGIGGAGVYRQVP